MRREPHSYPWCNLEGVKTATVGEEKGSAKQTLYKQIHSAQPVSLLLNPEGREKCAIYGAIPQQCLNMWCCCNTWEISVISFQEESENNPSLTKAIINSRKYHSSTPSKQYRIAGDLPFLISHNFISFSSTFYLPTCNPEMFSIYWATTSILTHVSYFLSTLMKRLPCFHVFGF